MLPINLSKLNACVIKNVIIECKKIKDIQTVKILIKLRFNFVRFFENNKKNKIIDCPIAVPNANED